MPMRASDGADALIDLTAPSRPPPPDVKPFAAAEMMSVAGMFDAQNESVPPVRTAEVKRRRRSRASKRKPRERPYLPVSSDRVLSKLAAPAQRVHRADGAERLGLSPLILRKEVSPAPPIDHLHTFPNREPPDDSPVASQGPARSVVKKEAKLQPAGLSSAQGSSVVIDLADTISPAPSPPPPQAVPPARSLPSRVKVKPEARRLRWDSTRAQVASMPPDSLARVLAQDTVLTGKDTGMMLVHFPPNMPIRSHARRDQPPVHRSRYDMRPDAHELPYIDPAAVLNNPSRISDLPHSRIGTIKVYKSGKVRMILGRVEFDLDLGHESQYYEQLLVAIADQAKAKAEDKDGSAEDDDDDDGDAKMNGDNKPTMYDLGTVQKHLVASLSEAYLEQQLSSDHFDGAMFVDLT